MIGTLGVNKCQKCQWHASSLLSMPNGCNVLALFISLFIKLASRAFLSESRLLRMSSIGMRLTSVIEWPAWLKCSDTGVGMLRYSWFTIERRCSPKPSMSWRLVSPMYWRWHFLHSISYMRFFDWQDMVGNFVFNNLIIYSVLFVFGHLRRRYMICFPSNSLMKGIVETILKFCGVAARKTFFKSYTFSCF